ncbi:RNA-binding protein 38-like [Sarcoptes scabiei]|nr:RNA-binding protein 38-like [Sarcoptes scabiei]
MINNLKRIQRHWIAIMMAMVNAIDPREREREISIQTIEASNDLNLKGREKKSKEIETKNQINTLIIINLNISIGNIGTFWVQISHSQYKHPPTARSDTLN